MPEWTPIVLDVATGMPVGALDQVLQNQDELRRRTHEAAGLVFPLWKEFGTYYNYGIPIAAIGATAIGWLKGDWARRLLTLGSALAGRKLVFQFTKVTQATPWRPAPKLEPPPARQTTQKPEFHRVGIT